MWIYSSHHLVCEPSEFTLTFNGFCSHLPFTDVLSRLLFVEQRVPVR